MLNLITKFSLLISIFTMYTIVYVAVSMMNIIWFVHVWFSIISWCFYIGNIMMGTLCCYLLFGMNTREFIYLCKCCHNRCTICCKFLVKRSIKKKTNVTKTQMKEHVELASAGSLMFILVVYVCTIDQNRFSCSQKKTRKHKNLSE